MIPVLSTDQIRKADEFTIAHEPIRSIDLMERACTAFTAWFTAKFDTDKRVAIFAGTGNNGGDGLGIARMLFEKGFRVQVYLVGGGRLSEDCATNLGRLPGTLAPARIERIDQLPAPDVDLIIDGLFGSGLSRKVEGIFAEAIHAINRSPARRISIDIPSGMMADSPSDGAIVEAHFTVSFQLPKLGFFLPENARYAGEWSLADIGLDMDFIRSQQSPHAFVEETDIRSIRKSRSRFDHKGTYGKALLVAGSRGKIGAAVLASRAALRSGLGLLTVHTPGCGYPVLQTAAPEAMVEVDESETIVTRVALHEGLAAVGAGPGLGTDPQTVHALAQLIEHFGKPMVLDADALNILSSHRELLHLVPSGSILTPHPGEFERLAGAWNSSFDRLAMQKAMAKEMQCIIVVKGAYSSIASPDGRIFFNPTGNPGMATGGSGDVLTGLLTGLLAQGYAPLEAALFGVYLHGLAGDLAAERLGQEALLASDLVEAFSGAFLRLKGDS